MSKSKSHNPVVIIPTHKATPTPEEIISLKQCQKILGLRNIYLVVPKGLDIQLYIDILPTSKVYEVPKDCMSSHRAYNQLMMSPRLFNEFKEYSHMLIHEPDSIVLKDELDSWCSQNFDYIGAPWFKKNLNGVFELDKTGNFGFALLNLTSINAVFSKNSRWYTPSMILRDILRGLRGKKNFFHRAFMALGSAGKCSNAFKLYEDHCDIFWCYLIPKIAPKFRIAPPQVAVNFAWETHLSKCACLTKNQLPFGIHAWSKHDPGFLKPLLETAGISIIKTPDMHRMNK